STSGPRPDRPSAGRRRGGRRSPTGSGGRGWPSGCVAGPAAAAAAGGGRPARAPLPHLLTRLRGLVSADTGVAHLAAALGVITVTLFGPTDPRLTAPRSARARVVAPGAPCAPCFLDVCPIDHVCM